MSSLTGGNAVVGGVPTVSLDVPILAVLIVLFAAGSATNIAIYSRNRKRNHKFLMSLFLHGFCIVRVLTCSMRIAWATQPTNKSLVIAAQVFNNAGIIIIYILNLIFAQRILRARQPGLGWNPVLGVAFKAFYGLIIACLVMAITALVLMVTSTNPSTLSACHDIQMTSVTFLFIMTTLPLFILAITYLMPEHRDKETFGHGPMSTKVLIVIISTCLSITIAGFKTGTAWDPRPLSNPAWFDEKPAYYVFGFTLEIIVLWLLILSRIDLRFHVPNKSKGPGDYSQSIELSSVVSEEIKRPCTQKE
ncbi:hypothetical protein B0J13DRAFT_62529 [Dactylonectria estremocensis]|uniref:Uncharacterized protein n=1 Tax=Dactylonectria estremocensis TaxID=1079267 RepID=A0A9P9J2Z9_9HYPO|nr:hypothetical protein B0J13DRAFT_62529 [Dactylonectria estremocensis]